MKRLVEDYRGESFDVIVVGGGINGAAIAYDAALRGWSVALLEKQDFGGATSAATSRLIHGGFRYLANLEFGMVRESLRERRILENIAPNLVYPIPVLVPSYQTGIARNPWVLRAGMLLYDLLSYGKADTWDPGKKIGRHQTLSRDKALALEPVIPETGLKDVFLYHDCQSLFPERLTLAFIKSAVKHGARVANYAQVEGFIFSNGTRREIAGVKVRDLLHQRAVEVRGRLTINCGGPWADLILGLALGEPSAKKIRRSEGIHVITRKLVNHHMVVLISPAGRGIFLIPWRGRTLIGTTDKEYVGDPDEFKVTKTAILELLETVNGALQGKTRIGYEDVMHTYGGLRPLVEDQTKEVYTSSRKYEIYDHAQDGLEGLLTVEGGKYTTSRGLAQNATKRMAAKLQKPGKCLTDQQHLAGCEINDLAIFLSQLKADYPDFDEKTVERLGRYYGQEAAEVLALARQDHSLAETLNDQGEILAQAVYAIRREMALTLPDILVRRTGLGALGHPGKATLAKLAERAAQELGWAEARKEAEIQAADRLFRLPE